MGLYDLHQEPGHDLQVIGPDYQAAFSSLAWRIAQLDALSQFSMGTVEQARLAECMDIIRRVENLLIVMKVGTDERRDPTLT